MSDDPLVTAAVTPVPLPEYFDTPAMVQLARDLAIGMYDEAIILKRAGLTPGMYETLKQNPYFQKFVEQMAIDWNQPKNAQQRLALQAAVGLEKVLPTVIGRAEIKNEPLQAVAQLVKVLGDLAGANNQNKQAAAPSEKFTITINLGADTETYEKTKPVVEVANDFDDPIQEVRSGIQSLLTLQTEPETS